MFTTCIYLYLECIKLFRIKCFFVNTLLNTKLGTCHIFFVLLKRNFSFLLVPLAKKHCLIYIVMSFSKNKKNCNK
jgi:hypothetical protein